MLSLTLNFLPPVLFVALAGWLLRRCKADVVALPIMAAAVLLWGSTASAGSSISVAGAMDRLAIWFFLAVTMWHINRLTWEPAHSILRSYLPVSFVPGIALSLSIEDVQGQASARPTFCAVIPTYNSGPYLRLAIDSILAQTLQPDEIIVIDDGSTDGTPDVVRSYGSRIQLHCQANRGQGAARNVAMRLAKSDWIALLDHDDIWEPEKLAAQAQAVRDNPDAAVIYTDSRYLEDDRIIELLPAPDPDVLPKVLQRLSPFAPSSVVLRKEVILAEGGFSEVRGMLEDWDLWLRLIGRHRFVRVPQYLTKFRKSRTQVTSQADKFLSVHMMCVDRTLLKNVKPPIRWFRRARLYSYFLADCAVMLREQKNPAALRYLLRAIAWWPPPVAWNDKRYKVLAHMAWTRLGGGRRK